MRNLFGKILNFLYKILASIFRKFLFCRLNTKTTTKNTLGVKTKWFLVLNFIILYMTSIFYNAIWLSLTRYVVNAWRILMYFFDKFNVLIILIVLLISLFWLRIVVGSGNRTILTKVLSIQTFYCFSGRVTRVQMDTGNWCLPRSLPLAVWLLTVFPWPSQKGMVAWCTAQWCAS